MGGSLTAVGWAGIPTGRVSGDLYCSDARHRDPRIRRARSPEARVSVPDPVPSSRELLVRVYASGVNRADLLQRRGLYPPPPGASDVPGLEFAGVVEEVGAAVAWWKVGDRVMGIVGGGGYAEYVVVDERVAVGVPAGMDLTVAGAIPEV